MWQRYQSRQPLLFYSLCSLITANFHITNSQTILQNCTYLHFLHDLLHLIHRSTITREYLNSISTVIFGRLLEQRKPRDCKLTVLPKVVKRCFMVFLYRSFTDFHQGFHLEFFQEFSLGIASKVSLGVFFRDSFRCFFKIPREILPWI